MLRTPGSSRSARFQKYTPSYGNVVALGGEGRIRKAVGEELLAEMVSDYIDLLGTSGAVYEIDGTYALGIFASGWCRLMDAASRDLCRTEDNIEALESRNWLCHESCWRDASLVSIRTGRPSDVPCNGGLRLFAVPVFAGTECVGSMNFGYGDPPTDTEELARLAELYNLDKEALEIEAPRYMHRPSFIVEFAKARLQTTAQIVGEFVLRSERATT